MMQDHSTRLRKIAGSILCIIIAVYFLVSPIYALFHFEDYASALPHFLRYVAVPAFISLTLVTCAFRLRSDTRLLVGINVLAVLVALFIFEFFLSLNNTKMMAIGLSFDERRKTDAARGVLHAFPVGRMNEVLGVKRLEDALLGGIPHTKVRLCRYGSEEIYYTADRLGFNNPDQVYERPVEVAVVGDSFIEGFCLPPGQDMVSWLRQHVPGAVSLAIRGNGPTLDTAMIGRHAASLRPAHVVIAFYEGNDMRNLYWEMRAPWLQPVFGDGPADYGPTPAAPAMIEQARQQALVWQNTDVGLVEVLDRTSIGRNFLALALTSSALGLEYGRVPRHFDKLAAVFRQAAHVAGQWSGKVHLAYIPTKARYIGLLPHDFVYDRIRNGVLDAARQSGLGVIDFVELYATDTTPLRFYADDGHFSLDGAAFVAEQVARAIGASGSDRTHTATGPAGPQQHGEAPVGAAGARRVP